MKAVGLINEAGPPTRRPLHMELSSNRGLTAPARKAWHALHLDPKFLAAQRALDEMRRGE